jgi:hypothetical protein
VPLGIAVGRVVWRVFATNFGVVPLTVVDALPVAALAFGVLAVVNVLAFSPRCWPRDHARPSCEPNEDPSDSGRPAAEAATSNGQI